MLRLLILATCFLLAAVTLHVARNEKVFGIRFGACFANLFFLGGPLLWLAISGDIPLLSDFSYTSLDDVQLADADFVLYVCAATIASSLLLLALPLKQLNRLVVGSPSKPRRDKVMLHLAVGVYAIGTLVIYLYALASPDAHWYRSREEFVATTGVLGLVVSYLVPGGRLIVIASIATSLYRSGFKKANLAVAFLFALYDLFITGNRVGLLLLLFCFFSVALARKNYRSVIVGLICAPALACLLSLYAYVRPYVLSSDSLSAVIEASAENIDQSVDGVAPIFLGAIESVNFSTMKGLFYEKSAIPLQLGSTYLRPLLVFIPRSVWADKPESPTVQAGNAFAAGRTSLVVTYIGEGIINFGRFGFLIGIGFIAISTLALSYIFRGWEGHGVLQSMLAFLSIRMAFSDIVIWTIAAAIIWGASVFTSRIVIRQSQLGIGLK